MLAALLSAPSLACGVSGVQEAAFEQACSRECQVTSPANLCATYCQCSYDWIERNDRMADVEAADAWNGTGPMPAVLVDLMSACGSDIYDERFQTQCVEGCLAQAPDGEADCREGCACMLRELRGTEPRPASTRFLIEHCDPDPPSPAGEARLDAAEARCLQAD